MGQYHKIVNLTQHEVLSPRAMGSGAKLMEFGQDHVATMSALVLLLHSRWSGHRIAIVGDYGHVEDWPAHVRDHSNLDAESAYDDTRLTDVSRVCRTALSAGLVTFTETTLGGWRATAVPQDPDGKCREYVVVNLDKMQMLRAEQFGQPRPLHRMLLTGGHGGLGMALAALLAGASRDGGRGGGDIRSDSPLVGSWAGDRLTLRLAAFSGSAVDLSPACREMLTEAGEGKYRQISDGSVERLMPF